MKSKWDQYHEQPVAVQLVTNYFAVTRINEFLVKTDPETGQLTMPNVPFLRGLAKITKGDDGLLMTVRCPDPDPVPGSTVDKFINVTFDPDKCIVFISKGEEDARIVTP